MIRKALITMAVLGATSTAALARPIISASVGVEASWTSSPSVEVRDHRRVDTYTHTQRPRRVNLNQIRFARRFLHRPAYEQRLVMLSEVNRINSNRGEVWLKGKQARTIVIQANGPMRVDQIGVEYWSGGQIQHQLINANVTLGAFTPAYTFDLGGTVMLNRIIVYGQNGSATAGFSVLGR